MRGCSEEFASVLPVGNKLSHVDLNNDSLLEWHETTDSPSFPNLTTQYAMHQMTVLATLALACARYPRSTCTHRYRQPEASQRNVQRCAWTNLATTGYYQGSPKLFVHYHGKARRIRNLPLLGVASRQPLGSAVQADADRGCRLCDHEERRDGI
eukprot:7336413-Prymnesium_polylepis.1